MCAGVVDGCTHNKLYTRTFSSSRLTNDSHESLPWPSLACCHNVSSLSGLFVHALASKETLDIRKLLRIFIQHTPLAVRQREQDNFTDILRKLVRMRQQCIPGRFSPPPQNGLGTRLIFRMRACAHIISYAHADRLATAIASCAAALHAHAS